MCVQLLVYAAKIGCMQLHRVLNALLQQQCQGLNTPVRVSPSIWCGVQARHDSQSMELMAEIRTLTMRVSELEENNTSLLRALKDAQASSAQRHVSPQHHVSAAPPPAGPPAPAVAPPVPQQPSSPIAMQQPLHTAGQLTRAPASMQGPASIQAQPGPEYAMTPASPSTGDYPLPLQ